MATLSGYQSVASQTNLPSFPPSNVNNMGLQYGLDKSDLCVKKTHRWLFEIPGVCADNTVGIDALPPEKSSRPSVSFKEMEVKHLIEDVYYPAKPDWKTFTVTVFDLKKTNHPVFQWFKKVYDPKKGKFYPANLNGSTLQQSDKFIKECFLKLYDGCGNVIEKWIYEDVWPQSTNFQSLDMGSSAFLTCEITLRYARAYIED